MARIRGVFLSHHPSNDELREARSRLRRTSCPRRYCWWWASLSFDFELSIDQGCDLAASWPWKIAPDHRPVCCRATGNSGHADYYEPREPHLLEDGFPEDYFSVVAKKYRRRKFERRARGEALEARRRRERRED